MGTNNNVFYIWHFQCCANRLYFVKGWAIFYAIKHGNRPQVPLAVKITFSCLLPTEHMGRFQKCTRMFCMVPLSPIPFTFVENTSKQEEWCFLLYIQCNACAPSLEGDKRVGSQLWLWVSSLPRSQPLFVPDHKVRSGPSIPCHHCPLTVGWIMSPWFYDSSLCLCGCWHYMLRWAHRHQPPPGLYPIWSKPDSPLDVNPLLTLKPLTQKSLQAYIPTPFWWWFPTLNGHFPASVTRKSDIACTGIGALFLPFYWNPEFCLTPLLTLL